MHNAAVEFDPVAFKAAFSAMKDKTDAELVESFHAACMLLDNTSRSIVKDLCERKNLLYLLTCHIQQLKDRGTGMVGMLTNASEGKVSVGISPIGTANWYQQTQCGSIFWQATAKYRRGVRYFASCEKHTWR